MSRQSHLGSIAARKRSEERLPVRFTTVKVFRNENQAAVKCRWSRCWTWVEWVHGFGRAKGGLLPMTDPMRWVSTEELDDMVVYTVNVKDCHLSNCIEAPSFVRKLWGGI